MAIEDSVAMPDPWTGRSLRDGYWAGVSRLTLGLVRARDDSLWLGPLALLNFGPAEVAQNSVQWPIEGGLLARAPGGWVRIEASHDRLVASVDGYEPMLPRIVYTLTQLPVHHLWTRLNLLRLCGRTPEPGPRSDPARRLAAAAIDAGMCATLAAVIGGRNRRVPALLGIAAAYHVACWRISGRTLGGAIMKQRVVSVDGSGLSVGQAVVRLALLPIAAVRRRNVHDEIAGTDVIAD